MQYAYGDFIRSICMGEALKGSRRLYLYMGRPIYYAYGPACTRMGSPYAYIWLLVHILYGTAHMRTGITDTCSYGKEQG